MLDAGLIADYLAGEPRGWTMAAARKSKNSSKNNSPSERSNLELLGERLEVVSLQTLLTNKKRPDTRDAARLGDVLLPWFERTVARPAARMEGVAELWQLHVSANIVKHSRLAGFLKGTLTVALDSATVRAELETRLRSGLLRVLQTESKGALFRVKTMVDGGANKA